MKSHGPRPSQPRTTARLQPRILRPHPAQEPRPLATRLPAIHKLLRARLVQGRRTHTRPVVMRHHMIQRNVVLAHQVSRQLGSARHRLGETVPTVIAHFDPDRKIIPRPVKIRMLPLLPRRDVLNGHVLLHCKMPRQKSNPVPPRTLVRPQCPHLQRLRMRIGIPIRILRLMNRNVARKHRPIQPPPILPRLNKILLQTHLPQHPHRRHHPTRSTADLTLPMLPLIRRAGGKINETRRERGQRGKNWEMVESVFHGNRSEQGAPFITGKPQD